MKHNLHNLTVITQEAHVITSPWFVGSSTPVQTAVMDPCEPPNRATREEIEAIDPSSAPYGGEER